MQQLATLDVRDLQGSPTQRAAFVAALGHALSELGFVVLDGHAVDAALTEPVYAALRGFFALPADAKQEYLVPGGAGARGYTAFGVEQAKDANVPDLKEFWHVGRELPTSDPLHSQMAPNVWPSEPALRGFKPAMLALYSALDALGTQLLEAVAEHLDLPDHYFHTRTDHGNSILRPLHYPPLRADSEANSGSLGAVRSAAHEDINLITLLVGSGEPGLQVRTRAGEWLDVGTEPGKVICNVGDMLQRLTNHRLVSTTHRVVNPPEPWASRSRYSVPFFLHPNSEMPIASLPSCVTAENPDRYPEPITADAYLQQRLREIGLL